jgi:diguanylate cyclase (GGDEF)-like protein/PAS domain S-box-containing protein
MATKGLIILAIDDQPDNLITLKAVLKDAIPDALLLTAVSGAGGIDIARRENPDVILLDIVMPRMDGFEVCRRLKSDPTLRVIPVLFLTALRANREIRQKALLAGAEGFLNKPLDEIELIAQVMTMAKIKQGNITQINQKERLLLLVEERTRELQRQIQERMVIEAELRESEERYKAIFEQSPLGIALTDSLTGQFYHANTKYCEIIGVPIDDKVGYVDWMKMTHPDDLEEDLANMNLLNEGKIRGFNMEKRFIRPDGTLIWVSMRVTPSNIKTYSHPCHLSMIEDISERKNKEVEIIYLNNHDVLTGLYNRTFFDEEAKRLDVERQLPLSVIIGDINGLKLINDAFGHVDGDRLLTETANILQSCCRQEDILARIGGDEFGILLPKTNREEAHAMLRRISEAFEADQINPARGTYFLSISLGFGTKEIPEELMANVLKAAEDHMYRRKLLEHRSLHSSILASIKATMHEKSHETREHGERLAKMSLYVGRKLNLSDDQLQDLELLSNLHDIGKIIIDDHILTKTGKLTELEWIQMKKHPEIGYRIAQASPDIRHISEGILCHHERWDGKGYPQRLAGEAVPLLSRILSVVDAYDAMTHDRTYRKALTVIEALEEIEMNSGKQFDPVIAGIFIELIQNQTEVAELIGCI